MKIQILYLQGCPCLLKTKELIEKSLKEMNIKAEIVEILIDSEEKARKYNFAGSPTVRIENEDIQEDHEKMYDGRIIYGCRIYFYKGKYYPYPPKEMIKEAIKRKS